MARVGKTEKNGPGLLFIVVTLIVVAVVGARFFGFMPGDKEEEAPRPPVVKVEDPAPPQGEAVEEVPKVLVFHSHASENYKPKDSHERGGKGDVVAVGEAFVEELALLGIKAIHDQTIHDQPRYSEAFLNSEKKVSELLAANPTVQVVLDLSLIHIFPGGPFAPRWRGDLSVPHALLPGLSISPQPAGGDRLRTEGGGGRGAGRRAFNSKLQRLWHSRILHSGRYRGLAGHYVFL